MFFPWRRQDRLHANLSRSVSLFYLSYVKKINRLGKR
jgi:hypothetical protein